jgi:Xaa-Pro aminopeptidase
MRRVASGSMRHLRDIQRWLRGTNLVGMVIPSTDEYLSEFAPAANRRLRWATGFRGSTGVAVVLRDAAVLFLDGRYQLQGAGDTDETGIAIESASPETRRAWLKTWVPPGTRLGIDPLLHSATDAAQWQATAAERGFEVALLEANPIDRLWVRGRPRPHRPWIVDFPVCYAGESYQRKCAGLSEHIEAAGLHALLVAEPEDVSWLLNVRAAPETLKTRVGDWHVVPSCTSRVLVKRDGRVMWFVDGDRLTPGVLARGVDFLAVAPPDTVAAALRDEAAQGPIGADLRRTPAALAAIIEAHGELRAEDIVARCRWRKHPVEVDGARRAHMMDAVATVRFMAWLTHTVRERSVTELEAAEVLEAFRAEHSEYQGASMPLMSASGPSGAEPHYVPHRSRNRRLNDHPIYWMDSGGQYPSGTTDNTVTLALGDPDARHILVHTLVLQGWIALATTQFPEGTLALHLDPIARQPLWRAGMDYDHGTGHGVGTYLNIHEGPQMGRLPGPTTAVPLEPGMILSNEPAYYAPGDFGVRIESHMVVVASAHPHFLEFDTISRLPIDPRLVDFERLSPPERRWLAGYHRRLVTDLVPLLDSTSATWLRTLAGAFTT